MKLKRAARSLGAVAALDQLYGNSSDPFAAEVSRYRYQQRKYSSLLSMLPGRMYRNALDVGCGIGAFTRRLAPYSESVLGTDISEVAIRRARELTSGTPHVRYAVESVVDLPKREAAFDLIIVADTLYYSDTPGAARIRKVSGDLAENLLPGGILLLVNHYFFGFDPQSRLTRATHTIFHDEPLLACVAEYRRPFFLASLFQRADVPGATR